MVIRMRAPTQLPHLVTVGLERLRRTGHRGNLIPPHRAFHRLHLSKRRLAVGAVFALLCTAALLALRTTISACWGDVLTWWLQAMTLPGLVITAAPADNGWLALAVPRAEVPALPPQAGLPLLHAGLIAGCWWLAGRLPDAAMPWAYLLRFAMLIQGVALLFFWLWPASFLHSVSEHTANGLRQTWALMLLTPWLHLGTYYLFPFPAWHSLMFTLLTLAYLLVLAPLQYALHAALLVHLGLVVMPLLYLLFGVMLDILGFVALYAWAMSWHQPGAERG